MCYFVNQAVQNSPVFESYYNNVVQQLDFNFTQLDVLVHQEAILDIVQWANDLQDTLSNITKVCLLRTWLPVQSLICSQLFCSIAVSQNIELVNVK